MKKIIVLLFLISSFAIAQENNNFSDNGFISLSDNDFAFIITLVDDLNRTIEIWDTATQIPGLSASTKVTENGRISIFIAFGTMKDENLNLTYNVKLKEPDGNFSPNEYNDLIIFRARVNRNMFFRGRQLLTIQFDETDEFGKYQFHISIKNGGRIIHNFIMEFEYLEK
jgi:hypothetical protein